MRDERRLLRFIPHPSSLIPQYRRGHARAERGSPIIAVAPHPEMPMNRVAIAVLLTAPLCRADDNCPQFRGGARAGVAEAKTLPDTWDTTKNVVWKVDVPGRGWSSPVVWGDHIY